MKEFFKSTKGVLLIACTSFIVLVALLSTAIYFLSAGQKPLKNEANAPVLAFWEVMKFAFDPEKMRHISRSEGAFFRAMEASRQHQYQKAHDYYEEANHEILLGAGDQSILAATFIEHQAVFENNWGNYKLAVPLCRKVLTMMPYCNDATLLLRTRQQLARALVFGDKAQKSEACQICQDSLAIAEAEDKDHGVAGYNTETSSVLEWLAYCQRQAGRDDEAMATYKKTIDLYELHGPKPKEATATKKITTIYIKLASVQLERGNTAAAIAYYDTALAKDPGAVRLLRLRCAARLKTGDYDGAIADTLAADKIKPNNVVTTDELLSIYSARGDHQAALNAINRVIGKNSDDDPYFYALRGFINADQKQLDRAVFDLKKAAVLSPKEPVYRRYLACIYAGSGQYKQAIVELDSCVDIKNSTLQARYLRSNAYANLHDYKAAITDLGFVLSTMHHFGFTLEEIKGFQVKYKFVDKPMLLRTRAEYYDFEHQPAKALADRKAADAAVKAMGKGPGNNYSGTDYYDGREGEDDDDNDDDNKGD